MSSAHTNPVEGTRTHGDPAVEVARTREDVIVGDEIVRHKRSARLMHWSVALFFFLCLFTGLPIWTPVFGWLAALFGGLAVCRWLHPWAGVVFCIAVAAMFVQWWGRMLLERSERAWLGPKFFTYLRYQEAADENVGKYNGGQKLLFWFSGLAALLLLVSGVVLWFPESFGATLRELSILLHDVSFFFFVAAIIGHIYLGTAAEPGTFRSMTRGTVTKSWARLHHPRWYREVGGEDERPR